MSLDPLLLDVLACPEDKGPLLWFEDEDVLYNPRLHKSYAVVDGVPVLLVDEAVAVGDPEHERLMAKAEQRQGAGHRPGVWVSERARSTAARHARDVGGRGRTARAAVRGARGGRGRLREASLPRPAAHSGPSPRSAWAPAGRPAPPRPRSAAPDLPVPFWVGQGSALPAFVDAVHAGPRGLVLGRHRRDGDGRREGGRARGDAWWPSGVSRTVRWPAWPRTPGCPGARAGHADVVRAAVAGRSPALRWERPRCRCWSRWPGPACGPTARPRCDGGRGRLARRRDAFLAPGGAAGELARRLGRTIPLVYGSAGAAAVAAQWWKAQVNLNAKAPGLRGDAARS